MVVIEALKSRFNKGLDANLYYYRDTHQNEINLIYKKGNQLIPIEIKSTMTYNDQFLKGVRYYKKLTASNANAHLLYNGELEIKTDDINVLNYTNWYRIFE